LNSGPRITSTTGEVELPEAGLTGENKLPTSTRIAIIGFAIFPMPLAYKKSGPQGRAQLFFQRKFGLTELDFRR
jgi:hypothetical protein